MLVSKNNGDRWRFSKMTLLDALGNSPMTNLWLRLDQVFLVKVLSVRRHCLCKMFSYTSFPNLTGFLFSCPQSLNHKELIIDCMIQVLVWSLNFCCQIDVFLIYKGRHFVSHFLTLFVMTLYSAPIMRCFTRNDDQSIEWLHFYWSIFIKQKLNASYLANNSW